MLTLLITVAAILSACAACAAALYPGACKKVERHHTAHPDYGSQPFEGWRATYHTLERARIRTALVVFGSYLVGMITLIVYQAMGAGDVDLTVPRILTGLFTVALLVIGLRSIIHNDRVWR